MNFISALKHWAQTVSDDDSPDYSKELDAIAQINKQVDLPEKPQIESESYERMQYDAPSDSDINKTAMDEMVDYKNAGVSKVENEIAALIEKYSGSKEQNAASLERTLNSLRAAYQTAVEEVNADAIRRGLARSSVAASSQAQLSEQKANAVAAAHAEMESKNAEVDEQLAQLELKRQKALDEFNIAYTVKLTERINELKEERDRKQSEVIKYNNSLTEKENEQEVENAKAESQLYSQALSQTKTENELRDSESEREKDIRYQQVYDILKDKLSSMSPRLAYTEVRENPIYREYLSTAYFYKLYDEFGRYEG